VRYESRLALSLSLASQSSNLECSDSRNAAAFWPKVVANLHSLRRLTATLAPHLNESQDDDSDDDDDDDDDDGGDAEFASGGRSSLRRSLRSVDRHGARSRSRNIMSVGVPVILAVLLRVIVGSYMAAVNGTLAPIRVTVTAVASLTRVDCCLH